MPEETKWNDFFDIDFILSELSIDSKIVDLVEIGSDISTPRGPDLNIRPKPEQITNWFDQQKFRIDKQPFIIEPYHFGLIISKI